MKRIFYILICLLASTICAFAQNDRYGVTDLNQVQKIQIAEMAIANFYVDSVDQKKLAEAAIIGMLEELDPHSSYTNPEETKSLNEPLEGNFEGIGVQFNILEDTLVVIQPTTKGPSEKAGILAGDRIISVDGKPIAGVKMPRDSVMRILRGPKGTKVKLGVVRRGIKDVMYFVVTRDKIPVNTLDASYMIAPGIGYIHLDRFGSTSGRCPMLSKRSRRKVCSASFSTCKTTAVAISVPPKRWPSSSFPQVRSSSSPKASRYLRNAFSQERAAVSAKANWSSL